MLKNPSIEKRIAAGFGIALFVLLVMSASAVWNASRFAATFRRVDHTHQVLYALERTMVEVLNVQNGSRGFLLTGNLSYLAAYDEALASVRRSIAELRVTTADNPNQERRLASLDRDVETLAAESHERHQIRRGAATSMAVNPASLEPGQQLLDAMIGVIRAMEQEERALLARRSTAFQDASHLTVVIVVAGGLLGASFLTIAALRIRRDFQRRRRAERELQEFFNLAQDPMVVLSRSGRVLRLNPAWQTILGHEPDKLRGRSFLELVHPDDVEFAQGQLQRLIRARATIAFEARYQTADGKWRWFQWSAISSASEGIMYGAARDITEHKQAIAALEKSAAEIRDLYNLAPCGYHSLDAEGRFISINDTELGWIGYTRTEVIGRLSFSDLLTTEGQAVFRETFGRFKALGWISDLEFELVRKDGSTFPVSLSATAIRDADGRYLANRSTLFDMTDRKRTEQQIRSLNVDLQLQNARLEIANKELESFSYSVSHDLRAPLRHIDGFASLLSKHSGATLDDKSRRFIAVISDSAKRMGRLIDDLLTFSRMGRAQMEEKKVNQEELVRSVIRESRFERDPQIEWDIRALSSVRGDESMLRQVWFNLLDNAVKYSAPATLPRIEIGCRRDLSDGGEVIFYVKDNGVGFDMKYAVKLFGVFQRLHAEAEFEGTGIGLASVRRIVTRHGGRTWAESAVGAGATFYFSLPASETTPPFPLS